MTFPLLKSNIISILGIPLLQLGETTPSENSYLAQCNQDLLDFEGECRRKFAIRYQIEEIDALTQMTALRSRVMLDDTPPEMQYRWMAEMQLWEERKSANPSKEETILSGRIQWDRFEFDEFEARFDVKLDRGNPVWTKEASVAIGESRMQRLMEFVEGEIDNTPVSGDVVEEPGKNSVADKLKKAEKEASNDENIGSPSIPESIPASATLDSTGTASGTELVAV